MKEQLQEFLQELKHNKNINKKENLADVVDLNYVIERITNILKEK